MGWLLDQTKYVWPEIRRNIKQAQKVWWRLGKLLRRERVDYRVAEIFYIAVKQTVLLFGLETWVISGATMRTV